MEVVRILFNPKYKRFINRGFLIGPYLPIYGFGIVAISLFLEKYSNDIPALFLLSIVICGLLEYCTSYFMEKMFNARWWDYSENKFNINGRICLETLIPFGIAGTIILHWTNPLIIDFLNKIPNTPKLIILYFLIILISIDTIISLTIISKFKNATKELDLSEADDTENISKYVKNKTEDVAMQLESDLKRRTRKLRLKSKRKMLHMKLKTNKKIARAKLDSKILQTKITNKINEKISVTKTSTQEFNEQIKEKFSNSNIFTKRLIDAFPEMQIIKKINKKRKK